MASLGEKKGIWDYQGLEEGENALCRALEDVQVSNDCGVY